MKPLSSACVITQPLPNLAFGGGEKMENQAKRPKYYFILSLFLGPVLKIRVWKLNGTGRTCQPQNSSLQDEKAFKEEHFLILALEDTALC